MGNKYHAKKTNGYDSAAEWRRAQELRLLERAGEISELREQVRYELIPAQYAPVPSAGSRRMKRKCIERACCYVADFVYKDRNGRTVVEDVKGVRTEAYRIKRKLMLWRYGIRIKEVHE